MPRSYLSHIFFVYSEANIAVMLALLASIELCCYLVVDEFWQPFALASAAFMAFLAVLNVLFIIREERAFKARRREWSTR